MSGTCELSFQQRGLVQQGYQGYSAQELRQLEWGLRFTPAVCAAFSLYGLLSHQPWILLAVAALGVWAFLAPALHPMDLLYNHGVRHLFGAAALPPNPLQRRLACLSAAFFNVVAATLLTAGHVHAAYAVGGMLFFFQAIVIFTHFCVLSWVYEVAARSLGSWNPLLDEELGRRLLADGAVLIDVRSPHEFAEGHLDGALNFPVETLETRLGELPEGTLLLYCRSGMRSNMALGKLRAGGRTGAHNLGGLERARALCGA